MTTINVLDHGFVKLRNVSGPTRRVYNPVQLPLGTFCGGSIEDAIGFDAHDIDPAQCARMSFEQMDTNRTYEQDMKLNEYLLVNEHTSPFEMISVWVEVKVPIFIDRQMVRHRTWSRNESSGRYIVLPADWYIPEIVGGKPVGGAKQGQSNTLPVKIQEDFKETLNEHCASSYMAYKASMDLGVAPEHARMLLHLNHYVHWIGKVDLNNLFKFLRLRADSHAQIEAQLYADAIIELIRPHLPGLMGLFDKHCRKGGTK
jgi:thymidylate synthase (FAD)